MVSFFQHRGVDYAIMHCVSLYPIPDDDFHLDRIDLLHRRYPNTVIGWSTHEDPDNITPVHIAVAKNAKMFERHVGIETDDIKLNAYSSTPAQVDKWIAGWKYAHQLCGNEDRDVNPKERESIDTLRRGVYAKRNIKKGQTISEDQVYFAMPYIEGQVESGQWVDGIVSDWDITIHEPVYQEAVDIPGGT